MSGRHGVLIYKPSSGYHVDCRLFFYTELTGLARFFCFVRVEGFGVISEDFGVMNEDFESMEDVWRQ